MPAKGKIRNTEGCGSGIIEIGIGEYAVSGAPETLVTYNLGSCVALALYDRVTRTGGLLHVKLPEGIHYVDDKGNKREMCSFRHESLSAYADSGIPILLYEFEKMGIRLSRLEAKIVGGAKMFPIENPALDVGRLNVEAVKRAVTKYKIQIKGEEVGGTVGRTVEFYLSTGLLKVISAFRDEKVI